MKWSSGLLHITLGSQLAKTMKISRVLGRPSATKRQPQFAGVRKLAEAGQHAAGQHATQWIVLKSDRQKRFATSEEGNVFGPAWAVPFGLPSDGRPVATRSWISFHRRLTAPVGP